FTARTGVVVQPFWANEETVGVVGLFTDQLTFFPVTGTQEWDVSADELESLDSRIGLAYNAMIGNIAFALQDPVKAGILGKGIRANLYPAPVPPDLTNAPVIQGWAVTNPWGQNPVNVNNDQAFPLIGWMEVEWRRPPGAILGLVAKTLVEASSGLDQHMKKMRAPAGPHGRPEPMVRTREAAAMISEVTPKTADNLTGEWRYRILDTRRQPTEEGRLWIRTNGSMVQGVLETPTHRRDLLTGNLTEEGRVLRLVRMSGP